jgi:hypothetical protein
VEGTGGEGEPATGLSGDGGFVEGGGNAVEVGEWARPFRARGGEAAWKPGVGPGRGARTARAAGRQAVAARHRARAPMWLEERERPRVGPTCN